MVRIIINSDDFGLSPSVNNAIVTAFNEKLISSTTCLVNFKRGLCDAVSIVNEGLIPKGSIGIHLNLTEGIPINTLTKNCNLLCEDGKFHGRIRNSPVFTLNKDQRKTVTLELESQVEKFIAGFGFSPSHIDGHHHIQTEWAIMNCVIEIAHKFKIKNVRLTRNIGKGISLSKRIYKKLFNSRLKLLGIITTDYFGDFEDLNHFQLKEKKCLELMVHAIASDNSEINDLDHSSLRKKVKSLNENYQYKLITYGEL